MQISPRYDADPIIRLDGDPAAVAMPLLRQRRRLAEVLASLSSDQWTAASRCDGWRVQDVAAHLTSVDNFWSMSVAAGLAGSPTRVLAAFDPKATPAMIVDGVRDASPAEALSSYVVAGEAFCAAVEAIDEAGWETIVETPAGHVTMSALGHHALWDCWVHERDVLLPLGMTQDEHADEIIASTRYAAALAPMFALQSGSEKRGVLAFDLESPTAQIVVTVGDDVSVTDGGPTADAFVVKGDAVATLEALSVRAPWAQPIPDEHAWLLTGLAEVFEVTA